MFRYCDPWHEGIAAKGTKNKEGGYNKGVPRPSHTVFVDFVPSVANSVEFTGTTEAVESGLPFHFSDKKSTLFLFFQPPYVLKKREVADAGVGK